VGSAGAREFCVVALTTALSDGDAPARDPALRNSSLVSSIVILMLPALILVHLRSQRN